MDELRKILRLSGVAVEDEEGVEGVAVAILCLICSFSGIRNGSGRLVVVVVGRNTSFSLALGLPVVDDSASMDRGCSGSGEKSEINSRR